MLGRLGILTLGVAIGQLIILSASPIITRLFDPSSLGLFGVFSGFAFLFGNISSFRYDTGIVLAKQEGMARAVFALCVLTISMFSCVVGLALWFGGAEVAARWNGSESLNALLYWLPLQMAAIGLSFILSQWATRKQQYNMLACSQVSRAVVIVIIQILCGWIMLQAEGLVIGQVVGYLLSSILLWRSVSLSEKTELRRAVYSYKRMRAAALRFRDLFFFSGPQELLSSASQPLTMLIIGTTYGPSAAGYFWLTQRVMQQPGSFLGQALRQVYIQHLASLHNNGQDISKPILKASLILMGGGLVGTAPIIFFGPQIFSYAFGSGWSEAGAFARWISLWVIALLANIPAWCGLQAMRLQGPALKWEIATVGVQTVCIYFLALKVNSEYAVAGYAVGGASMFISRTIYAYRRAKVLNRVMMQ